MQYDAYRDKLRLHRKPPCVGPTGMTEQYDLLVAGSGAGGCLVAARIAQHGKNPRTGAPLRVAVVEAGPWFGQGENRPGYGQPSRRRMNSFLNYEMGSRYVWPYGMAKVVGGSVLHWGTYAVTPSVFFDDDYVAWRNSTGVDWTKDNFREAVAEVQEMFNLKPAPEQVLTRGNKLFIQAARSMNLPTERFAIARRNCLFCGRCGNGHLCKYDAKGSSQPYIDLALKHGVEIIAEAEVQKVIFEKSGARVSARGFQFKRNSHIEEVRAPKVIVSCGITGTPMLLMRSGYGARDRVSAPLVAENINVGRNLESDFMVPVYALWDEDIKPSSGASTGASYVRQDWGADGEGRLILQDYQMSALTYPHEAALAKFAPAFGRAHKQYMKTAVRRIGGLYPFIGKTGVWGEVAANGEVNMAKDNGQLPRLLKWAADASTLSEQLLKKMGASKLDIPPPTKYVSFDLTHSAGTCRAGADPKTSVVNPHFESHDIEDLFICDASAVPRQQQYGAMPTATVAAFAWRRIVARHFT